MGLRTIGVALHLAAHDYKDGKKIIYGEKTNVACKAIV